MRRAKHPLPFEMWGMKTDPQTGKYFLIEKGVTYNLDIEHMRLLRDYFRSNSMDNPTIEKWFNDLDRFTKKEIVISGKCILTDLEFYPDPEY